MKEFSISQFTFNTYEQYMNWKGIITSLNEKERQSIEGCLRTGYRDSFTTNRTLDLPYEVNFGGFAVGIRTIVGCSN